MVCLFLYTFLCVSASEVGGGGVSQRQPCEDDVHRGLRREDPAQLLLSLVKQINHRFHWNDQRK